MKQPVTMPALSDTMESGRLLRWLKHQGDSVARGEAIAEVETDKAVMEMEAFHSGTLIGPLADEDQEYPVGETLAWIGDEKNGEAGADQGKREEQKEDKEKKEEQETEGQAEPGKQTPAEEPEKPAADEAPPMQQDRFGKAKEEKPQQAEPNVRLADETAGAGDKSGAGQRPSSAVLEQALAGRVSACKHKESDEHAELLKEIESGPPYRIEPQLLLRKVIAGTMSRAVQTPQFRISTQVDLTAFKTYADAHAASLTLLLARACALTVKEQPDFNAAWTPDGLARREQVDVAVAMEAEHGLLTPVVRDAAGRPLLELAENWRALKEKIRHHRMVPEDFRGATFYLSNLGMFPGIVQFDAVVPPGAAAILAVAAPGDTGTMLTLTCDHRVVFGADAARFLSALAERLAHPVE